MGRDGRAGGYLCGGYMWMVVGSHAGYGEGYLIQPRHDLHQLLIPSTPPSTSTTAPSNGRRAELSHGR